MRLTFVLAWISDVSREGFQFGELSFADYAEERGVTRGRKIITGAGVARRLLETNIDFLIFFYSSHDLILCGRGTHDYNFITGESIGEIALSAFRSCVIGEDFVGKQEGTDRAHGVGLSSVDKVSKEGGYCT
jgi:hypothetical protein